MEIFIKKTLLIVALILGLLGCTKKENEIQEMIQVKIRVLDAETN